MKLRTLIITLALGTGISTLVSITSHSAELLIVWLSASIFIGILLLQFSIQQKTRRYIVEKVNVVMVIAGTPILQLLATMALTISYDPPTPRMNSVLLVGILVSMWSIYRFCVLFWPFISRHSALNRANEATALSIEAIIAKELECDPRVVFIGSNYNYWLFREFRKTANAEDIVEALRVTRALLDWGQTETTSNLKLVEAFVIVFKRIISKDSLSWLSHQAQLHSESTKTSSDRDVAVFVGAPGIARKFIVELLKKPVSYNDVLLKFYVNEYHRYSN